MSIKQKRNRILLGLLFLLGMATIIAFAFITDKMYDASLAAAEHPLDTLMNDFIFACAVIAIIFLVAVIISIAWYVLSVRHKSRFGMMCASMLALPAVIALLTCWGWMIAFWCTGDGIDTSGSYIQGQLSAALSVSGISMLGLLPVVVLCGILRKGITRISRKLTHIQKRYCQAFLQSLGIIFSAFTFAILLFTLETCNSLTSRYPGKDFIWWLDSSALLHCCAALIAGIELFFGIRYLLNHAHNKVSIGSLLLSSCAMKFISIWACIYEVMDSAYRISFANTKVFTSCLLSIGLQCVFPAIMYIIAAQLHKRKHTVVNE